MENERKKKRQNPVSQLAEASFAAFHPYINIFDCGTAFLGNVFHSITKEDWRLFHRYKYGERGLTYPDGREFKPGRDVVCNIYSPRHVQRHMEAGEISYYTPGRNGRGLLYLDTDAHKPWQTDEYKAKAALQELFPFGYFRASRRGQNGFLKIKYDTAEEYNSLADRLERMLKQYFLSLGILCDIEIKGTITTKQKSGGLAKLPFTTARFPCNMRDETDNWNDSQLEKFKACPTVNLRHVEYIMGQIQIDEEKAVAFAEYKRSLDEAQKVADRAKQVQKSNSIPTSPCPSSIVAKPVVISQPKPSVRLSTVRLRTDLPPQESEDAFRRNLKDIPPFVRAFYSAHRRYPTTEEALEWLKANGRYSGEWEDRENRRAKRVEQILNFLEPDFNPEMLSKGKAWRWVQGENFPEKSLGEEQRKLKDKLVKRPSVSLVEFLADTYTYNNNIHNTLYYDETQISAVYQPDQQVRPPP